MVGARGAAGAHTPAGASRRELGQAIAEVTSAILEAQTGDKALQIIADVARKLVAAAQATVATAEPLPGQMVVRARVGQTAEADLGPAVIVPLKVADRSVGTISLTRATTQAPFTEEETSVIEAFAAQAALALEYARNLSEREKAERRVEAGAEVSRAIIEGRDTAEVLKLIASRARDLVGAAFAAIGSPEPGGDELIVRVADGAQAEAYRGTRIPLRGSLSGQVFATRRSIAISDAAGDTRLHQSAVQLGNLGPALLVPLYVANRSLGTMIVANQKGGATFTGEDMRLVESFAAQAAMRFEIATVRERLQRLTSVAIADEKPIEDALGALARTVVEATDIIACGIYLLDPDRNLVTAGTHGLPEGFLNTMQRAFRDAGARPPPLDAVDSGELVVREEAISRFLSEASSEASFEPVREMLRGVSWDTLVSVPLKRDGRIVGVLSGYYPRGYQLSDAEVAFLKIVADHAAAIAENARLFTNAQAHVAQEERQRLARELHDSVSQALYGIGLGARTARENLERDPAAAREPLDYVLQLAEAGLAEMRALIFELRPESLEREGLVGGLLKQAAALRARHGIKVDELVDAEPEAPIAVKEAVFRIVQEALNNTAKHARASHVVLRLSSAGETITAEIRDDGAGFDAREEFPGHLGLQSMRERAIRLGGTVEITSSPGQGTLVRAMLPRRAGA